MERKFPPGRLQGAPGLPLLNLEKLSFFYAAMAFGGCVVCTVLGIAGGADIIFAASVLDAAS